MDIGENLRGRTVYVMQTEDNNDDYTANGKVTILCVYLDFMQACK